MELKFVIPNMEKTFGNLEFAGENTTEDRTEKNQWTHDGTLPQLQSLFRRTEGG